MKAFMDDNFLLGSQTAEILYHVHAAPMPIIDYHCHINPEDIALDRNFANIAQLWLHGDHYKWRLMRLNGEDETNITGTVSSDHDKFMAFAAALPKAIGNPVYHWAHLELRRYFDCELALCPDTADDIWRHCGGKLAGGYSARDIIRRSRVETIATTDDPADDLRWHKMISEDPAFGVKVVPTFRPDKALNIDKPDFLTYIKRLGESAGISINTLDDLFLALSGRMDFFNKMGCRSSDHGMERVPFANDPEALASAALPKALRGECLDQGEIAAYQTALLLFLGMSYAQRGWVMQLHYGAIRNLNTRMFERLGPDTGFDAISGRECGSNIPALLDALGESLPKTVLYSLNPNDNTMLDSVCGAFTERGVSGKVQHGSAWWFNDTKQGMEDHITSLAGRGLLGGFIGMLTDSRSLLSYTRHEYFRRILCNILGAWAENGEYPADIAALGNITRDISYNNVKNYFGF